jgi:hypothetical protein
MNPLSGLLKAAQTEVIALPGIGMENIVSVSKGKGLTYSESFAKILSYKI